jgi:hypothetical protein
LGLGRGQTLLATPLKAIESRKACKRNTQSDNDQTEQTDRYEQLCEQETACSNTFFRHGLTPPSVLRIDLRSHVADERN